MELNKKELNDIIGGSISGSIISSIVRGGILILELGRSFGSALRRLLKKKYC
ncbi:unknown [Clostridium sp. CAG:1193]|jgi:bacteriocin-like protein|nr:unknown [Clostridium sp. CAG:1193]